MLEQYVRRPDDAPITALTAPYWFHCDKNMESMAEG